MIKFQSFEISGSKNQTKPNQNMTYVMSWSAKLTELTNVSWFTRTKQTKF